MDRPDDRSALTELDAAIESKRAELERLMQPRGAWLRDYDAVPKRDITFRTISGREVAPIYTPLDTGVQDPGYLERVGSKNAQARAEATREYNKETVRAFNLKTDKYQYVPADSLQRWNESEKRWEFAPDG